MITQEEANRIAAEFMGGPADDAEYGWSIQEFRSGWLVLDRWDDGAPMTGAYVVERASGRMLHFPSYIEPELIIASYPEVEGEGSPLREPLR
jgi:hypothetical protein